jgi:hypothetical protein
MFLQIGVVWTRSRNSGEEYYHLRDSSESDIDLKAKYTDAMRPSHPCTPFSLVSLHTLDFFILSSKALTKALMWLGVIYSSIDWGHFQISLSPPWHISEGRILCTPSVVTQFVWKYDSACKAASNVVYYKFPVPCLRILRKSTTAPTSSPWARPLAMGRHGTQHDYISLSGAARWPSQTHAIKALRFWPIQSVA